MNIEFSNQKTALRTLLTIAVGWMAIAVWMVYLMSQNTHSKWVYMLVGAVSLSLCDFAVSMISAYQLLSGKAQSNESD